VELDPLRVAELQHLGEVPGDRLALAIGVGREDDLGLFLDRRAKLVDGLAAALHDLVVRLEAVVDLHAHLLLRQVADVAHRRFDVEPLAQKPLQRFGLGGRLDDDQSFRHSFLFIPQIERLFRGPALGAGILRPFFARPQRP
jgi:hypothetical protein